MSFSAQANVVNTQMPALVHRRGEVLEGLHIAGFPSVACGSIFSGMPSTSGDTM